MEQDFVPNTIAVAVPAASFHKMSKLWALLLVALGVTAAVAAEAHWPAVSCERHEGAFGSAFSADFDINRLECRANWMKRSPTLNMGSSQNLFQNVR
jgi:isopentenyl diphosphate isomerase/L-lactate dehydrogenase-like FMN-dependent dehydrogenase